MPRANFVHFSRYYLLLPYIHIYTINLSTNHAPTETWRITKTVREKHGRKKQCAEFNTQFFHSRLHVIGYPSDPQVLCGVRTTGLPKLVETVMRMFKALVAYAGLKYLLGRPDISLNFAAVKFSIIVVCVAPLGLDGVTS